MLKDTSGKIKKLLEPIYDEKQWNEELKALDPALAIPLLVALLHDETEELWRRSRAAIILAELHDKRAIPYLVEALDSSNPVLRARVACSFGRLEKVDEDVAERLIDGIRDEDYFVRECSAKALAQLKRIDALSSLIEMSNTDRVPNNRNVARMAIESIKKIG